MEDRGETWPLKQLETATQANPIVDGKEVITLASNNYLDLTNDPCLRDSPRSRSSATES